MSRPRPAPRAPASRARPRPRPRPPPLSPSAPRPRLPCPVSPAACPAPPDPRARCPHGPLPRALRAGCSLTPCPAPPAPRPLAEAQVGAAPARAAGRSSGRGGGRRPGGPASVRCQWRAREPSVRCPPSGPAGGGSGPAGWGRPALWAAPGSRRAGVACSDPRSASGTRACAVRPAAPRGVRVSVSPWPRGDRVTCVCARVCASPFGPTAPAFGRRAGSRGGSSAAGSPPSCGPRSRGLGD